MDKELLWALKGLQWKSIEKDNMEFSCTTTCWVKDIIDNEIKKAED